MKMRKPSSYIRERPNMSPRRPTWVARSRTTLCGNDWPNQANIWFDTRACGLQQSRQRVSSEQHSEQIEPE